MDNIRDLTVVVNQVNATPDETRVKLRGIVTAATLRKMGVPEWPESQDEEAMIRLKKVVWDSPDAAASCTFVHESGKRLLTGAHLNVAGVHVGQRKGETIELVIVGGVPQKDRAAWLSILDGGAVKLDLDWQHQEELNLDGDGKKKGEKALEVAPPAKANGNGNGKVKAPAVRKNDRKGRGRGAQGSGPVGASAAGPPLVPAPGGFLG